MSHSLQLNKERFVGGATLDHRAADSAPGLRQLRSADMGFKTMLCVLCTAMAAAGAELQRNQCNDTQFWNNEIGQCLDCNMCKEFPKMPSCDTCLKMEDPSPNMWKVVALVSFSLIAVLAVLMIGVLVHHCKSEKNKPLREPIEETAGPLYAAV